MGIQPNGAINKLYNYIDIFVYFIYIISALFRYVRLFIYIERERVRERIYRKFDEMVGRYVQTRRLDETAKRLDEPLRQHALRGGRL